MKLAEAKELAAEVLGMLSPHCEYIRVAGSIRRHKEEVKDIEIVAIPKRAPVFDLFDVQTDTVSALDPAIDALVKAGTLAFDPDTKRNGPRYKRLRYQGVAVDLFLAEKENWGNIYAIRTGSGLYSRACVSLCQRRGYQQKDGYLWRGGKRQECRNEDAFFRFCGVPLLPPSDRTDEAAIRLCPWLKQE